MPTVFRDKKPQQNTFLSELLHRLVELWQPAPQPVLQRIRAHSPLMENTHHPNSNKQTNLKP